MRYRVVRSLILMACLSVVVISSLLAQAANQQYKLQYTTTRDPQALAALATCQAALGNPADLLGLVAQGTATPDQQGASPEPISFESGGVGLTKQVRTRGNGDFTVVMGRSNASIQQGGKTQVVPIAGSIYLRASLLPTHLCSPTLLQPEQSVVLIGIEVQGGKTLIHVQISAEATDASGKSVKHVHDISLLELWIDSATGLPWKSQSFAFPSANSMSRFVDEIFYTNYSAVSGVVLPQTVEEHLAGQKIETINWTTMAVQQVPAADFSVGVAK